MNRLNLSFLNEDKLPLLLEPKHTYQANLDYLIQYLKDQNALFKDYLLNYGAILLRGFNVTSADHFSRIINACSLGAIFNYDQCIIPRTLIKPGIYTSINAPEWVEVSMHNEKSYSDHFPNHVYFYCEKSATIAGNTPLMNGHQLWLSLPIALQKKLEKKGILYSKFYYGNGLESQLVSWMSKRFVEVTWMRHFQTDNKLDIETTFKKMNVEFEWASKGNGLILKTRRPAHRYHPINNKIVWFNQSNFNNNYYRSLSETVNLIKNPLYRFILSQQRFTSYIASFGDGEPISKSEATLIHDTIVNNKISIPWCQGDVMVVDNLLCLHGKEPHRGERMILTSLTK
jgi:alpha-ketoglutarate-dependent taurine dioxygenase